MRRYLAHRDGGCRFPGCTRPARACEPDHTTEWQHGGRTDPHNLALLCRRHHALKSIGAWTYHHQPDRHQPDGCLRWRPVLGRWYTSEPDRLEDVPPHLRQGSTVGASIPRRDDPPPF
ncbi:HNH endonuclease [Sinomonas sp. 5-5]|uniref:HNH endonuclease n=1 Tax=Sinomonas terrae TaxID=2908838 RepID=A0ABS9U2I1_9MICC|nr:HNH endonuclease [Sinomonas terrae]